MENKDNGVFFVSCDGDKIGRMIGRKSQENDIPGLKILSHKIERGNEAIASWAMQHGGEVIESGGDEIRLSVPVGALQYVPTVKEYYKSVVGATLSVGVGRDLNEADKSLYAAKLLGGDATLFYGKEVEDLLTEASMKEDPESKKVIEAYMNKAEGFEGTLQDIPPVAPAVVQKPLVAPVEEEIPSSFAQDFNELAESHKAPETMGEAQHQEVSRIKEEVTGILKLLDSHMPDIERMKVQNPELFHLILQAVKSISKLAENTHKFPHKFAKDEEDPSEAPQPVDSPILQKPQKPIESRPKETFVPGTTKGAPAADAKSRIVETVGGKEVRVASGKVMNPKTGLPSGAGRGSEIRFK